MKTLFVAIIAIASLSLFSCTKDSLSARNEHSTLKSIHSLDGDNGNSESSEAKTILTVDFNHLDSFHAEVEIIVTDLYNANVYKFTSLDTLPVIQSVNIHRYHQYKVEYKNYNSEGATWGNYSMSCEYILSWDNSSLASMPYNQYSTVVKEPVTFGKDPVMSFSAFGCAFF